MELNKETTITDIDFEIFKKKVHASYELDLNAYKRPQMERRLRSIMEKCGATTFQRYFALLQNDKALLDEFLDKVTINVSELFRNPEHFDILKNTIIPELLRDHKDLKIWSAGCSYGAEPYTLAIILDELIPGASYSILATDIDSKMLLRAQKGVFQEQEVRNVSRARLSKYFKQINEGYEANETLKKKISFRKHNLFEDRFGTGYDLIVCRNVVIYFTEEAKNSLYRHFCDSIRPGGYLFLGGTERIVNYWSIGFDCPKPFFYRKLEKS